MCSMGHSLRMSKISTQQIHHWAVRSTKSISKRIPSCWRVCLATLPQCFAADLDCPCSPGQRQNRSNMFSDNTTTAWQWDRGPRTACSQFRRRVSTCSRSSNEFVCIQHVDSISRPWPIHIPCTLQWKLYVFIVSLSLHSNGRGTHWWVLRESLFKRCFSCSELLQPKQKEVNHGQSWSLVRVVVITPGKRRGASLSLQQGEFLFMATFLCWHHK